MKKVILSITISLIAISLFAQSPEAFNYQAVVRDEDGNPIPDTDVSFKFSIRQGSSTGTIVYEETHLTLTNKFGLITLEIGNGTPVIGNFSNISWYNDDYFIDVALDDTGGSNYQAIGTEQLFSVPYALHSTTVEYNDDADANPTNEIQNLSISGNNLTISSGNTIQIDGNSTNELQNLAINGNSLSISSGNSVQIDGNPSNEYQQLQISGDQLTIAPNGNTVQIPQFELPFNGSYSGDNEAFEIQHYGDDGNVCLFLKYNDNNPEHVIEAQNNSSQGSAANFRIMNSSNSYDALYVETDGNGTAGTFRQTNSSSNAKALWARTFGSGYAGYFEGDVYVLGTLSKLGGSFVIDHPTDPYNMVLRHSFVEAPERLNIYKGRAFLKEGKAVINLPEYFDALNNIDFREISITCINGWSPIYVDGKIENNQFTVKTTDQGNLMQEFSWVVYAVRNDKWAQDNPLVVEEEKGLTSRFEKGKLLYERTK